MAIQAVSGERSTKRIRRRQRHSWLRRAARMLLYLGIAVLLSIVIFRFIDPPTTSVMVLNKLTGGGVRQAWVPLDDISRQLPLAVIASEDGQFCRHWGVDLAAIRDAIKESGGLAGARGASTIPMQTAKNLYLWNGRSYVRKAFEAPLAVLMTAIWGRQRMMEVYLNVAQFGPGTYGAEAASQRYFGKSASQLTRREAVLLAVALPKPGVRNPARPSPLMVRIANKIERRMPIMAARSGCVVPQR
jgi:monofunctional biosynthetic peptidoglycan transglycosylase